MKRLLGLIAGALIVTMVASAASITLECNGTGSTLSRGAAGVGSIASSSSPETAVCPSFTVPAGYTLNSVKLYLYNDYSLGASSGTNSFAFVWGSIPTVFGVSGNQQTDTVSGGISSTAFTGTPVTTSTNPTTLSATVSYAEGSTFSSFTITLYAYTISGGLNSLSGTLSPDAYVEYDYDLPPGTVPEPGTMVLMGTGLIALVAIVRKRRAA